MWLYEAGTRRFLMVNDRAVEHYGWTREAFLEMRLTDVLLPGERVAPVRSDQAGQASRHRRRDGSEIDVVVRASPARFGDAQAVLEVVEDVTEGRAVQERLLLADRVFENAGSSIVITDAEARAISCNPAFTAVTGYSEAEIRGQNMRLLGSGRHPPEFFRGMWRSLLEDHQWRGEIWNRRKNGDVFLEWLVIQAVRGADGVTTHYVGSFVDITERRALQEQLAIASRLAAMGTLVAGVAHEINNPLAGVMGAQGSAIEELREILDDATRGKLAEPARLGAQLRELVETLGDAQSGSERIARIVRDLSLLGRPDTQRARVRLIDVVEEAMRWLPGSVARSAAIQVENGNAPDVIASAGQLAQVLINLVTNGAKAVPRGKQGLVTIRLGPGSRGMARLQVSDNGDGIDAEVLKRIFDPFFTTRRLGEGTGLGLPICHSIVTAHGGTIEVESRVGEGTTFTVELPAANAEA
jgi:PAS domain S-box-containing protein